MLNKDMTKVDIEEVLKSKGDFVKIDYLERFLKSNPPLDKKKFAYLKLAEIYEEKRMFVDAGKIYNTLAIFSVAFSDKIKHHIKEAEAYIKAGKFHDSDEAVKKALSDANISQKIEVKTTVKNFYKKQAESCEKDNLKNHAVKIYEKMLLMNPSEEEREEIKRRLMNLYEKTGKLKDYFRLKNG